MEELATNRELTALARVWNAIPSDTMPTIERMIEIIQVQHEELARLNALIEQMRKQ